MGFRLFASTTNAMSSIIDRVNFFPSLLSSPPNGSRLLKPVTVFGGKTESRARYIYIYIYYWTLSNRCCRWNNSRIIARWSGSRRNVKRAAVRNLSDEYSTRTRVRRGRRNPFVIIQRELLGNKQSCETAERSARTHGEQGRAALDFSSLSRRKARVCMYVRLSPTDSLGSVSSSLRARATDEIVIFSVAVPLFSRLVTMFRDHHHSLFLLPISIYRTCSRSYPNLWKGYKFEFVLTKRERKISVIVANCRDRMSRFNPRFIPVHTGSRFINLPSASR